MECHGHSTASPGVGPSRLQPKPTDDAQRPLVDARPHQPPPVQPAPGDDRGHLAGGARAEPLRHRPPVLAPRCVPDRRVRPEPEVRPPRRPIVRSARRGDPGPSPVVHPGTLATRDHASA
jgi:hypothetical protein